MIVFEMGKVDRVGGDVGYRIDRIWWLDIGNERGKIVEGFNSILGNLKKVGFI